MNKKFLIFCLILLSLPSFADDVMKGGVTYDYNTSIRANEIESKLPVIEKDFVDLNYSIEFKPLNLLPEDEMVIKKLPSFPSIKGGSRYIPDNYEVSLSTGRAKGNYDSSKNIEFMLRQNPNNNELLYAYAIQLKNEKQLEKALFIVNKALENNPDFALAHFLKGDILRNMEKYKEAVDEYLYTTQINPYCADAYYNIAKILELLDDRELALDYYKTAYQVNPNDTEIRDIILEHYIEL